AKLELPSEVSEEARGNLNDGGRSFLSELCSLLSECEWEESKIGVAISDAAEFSRIPKREGYAALYWSLIGRNYGPKASSLLCEMDREKVLRLLRSV
ncbi:MAG: hypothetical protein L7R66_02090, partial [Candidatus Thalassarchaeaceae archaeon]|nr:hypothetical protein [Candidatus Thalassarchaeaceae archaeon]